MAIHPLDPPDSITRAEKAVELIRIWSVDGEPHFSVRITGDQAPVGWGLVLVDIARLIASGYAEQKGVSVSAVLDEIRQGFDAEWQFPTNDQD